MQQQPLSKPILTVHHPPVKLRYLHALRHTILCFTYQASHVPNEVPQAQTAQTGFSTAALRYQTDPTEEDKHADEQRLDGHSGLQHTQTHT